MYSDCKRQGFQFIYRFLSFSLKAAVRNFSHVAQGVNARSQITYMNNLCNTFHPNLIEYNFLNMLFLNLALEKNVVNMTLRMLSEIQKDFSGTICLMCSVWNQLKRLEK